MCAFFFCVYAYIPHTHIYVCMCVYILHMCGCVCTRVYVCVGGGTLQLTSCKLLMWGLCFQKRLCLCVCVCVGCVCV